MKRVFLLAILFWLIFPIYLSGTTPLPDILIYEGDEYFFFDRVLEEYFKQQNYRPFLGMYVGYRAFFEIKETIYI